MTSVPIALWPGVLQYFMHDSVLQARSAAECDVGSFLFLRCSCPRALVKRVVSFASHVSLTPTMSVDMVALTTAMYVLCRNFHSCQSLSKLVKFLGFMPRANCHRGAVSRDQQIPPSTKQARKYCSVNNGRKQAAPLLCKERKDLVGHLLTMTCVTEAPGGALTSRANTCINTG